MDVFSYSTYIKCKNFNIYQSFDLFFFNQFKQFLLQIPFFNPLNKLENNKNLKIILLICIIFQLFVMPYIK